jgi:NTP pyrophosphatase (non-canonical NTP hydrolase)
MKEGEFKQITDLVRKVLEKYKVDYPDVKMDRDYLPFKITEEWGECLQTYLMLTDRGRQKGKTKEEIKDMLSDEFADMFSYLLLFAQDEGVDPVEAINKKWLKYLK